MFGLSGTRSFGPSGTGASVYREPESPATLRYCGVFRPLNNPNTESFGFLLTPAILSATGSQVPPTAPRLAADGDPQLTHVMLTWREGIREDWLRFGRPTAERIINRNTRIESFAPGQVFALVRWAFDGFVNACQTIRKASDRKREGGACAGLLGHRSG